MKPSPRYTHDCNKCRFITAIFGDDGVEDWYVCDGFDRSVIARRSNDGPDYWSMPTSMVNPGRVASEYGGDPSQTFLVGKHIVAHHVLQLAGVKP